MAAPGVESGCAAYADGGCAACADGGRERIVDAFRDARLKLVAASGMGS